jgi:hypothetical protein
MLENLVGDKYMKRLINWTKHLDLSKEAMYAWI